jgi:hypothetical protein
VKEERMSSWTGFTTGLDGQDGTCCGAVPELLGSEESGQFRVEARRCPTCGRVDWPVRRTDGQRFWVGAMTRFIQTLDEELAARLGLDPPTGVPAVFDRATGVVLRVEVDEEVANERARP